ncbi:conserved protein of unknown function [Candidatus Hydrogenisulfobacillus filiaventi]|uniref:Uncharacterized protein n=1 Tax=Candidatus Hydrogenisulfobacillus filiaventi TaxID=2707344 RepID=A0A6F8ZDP8_9FIRM|nr:conserved protein of unknown function [Candidatus Hydrogenisulfobacillus filiaventi]
MRPAPLHHSYPSIRWELPAWRETVAGRIRLATGDARWLGDPGGDEETWRLLLAVDGRGWEWRGPWLLLCDPTWVTPLLSRPPRSDTEALARHEAAWFWRSLEWGPYARPETWAIVAWLTQDVWPSSLAEAWEREPRRPVADWLRLERLGAVLWAMVACAAEGRARARWGAGWLDCGPLLRTGGVE